MSLIRDRRPGIAEWRAASLADYEDALNAVSAWRAALSAAVLEPMIRIRDRNESLLIRAGIIGNGDRL